jgi:hypothetical protein
MAAQMMRRILVDYARNPVMQSEAAECVSCHSRRRLPRRDAEALAQARHARELDPLSTMANAVVVYGLMLNHQFDEALDRVNKMLELDGSNPFTHVVLGQVYSAKERHSSRGRAGHGHRRCWSKCFAWTTAD